jgi:hypothetical protein
MDIIKFSVLAWILIGISIVAVLIMILSCIGICMSESKNKSTPPLEKEGTLLNHIAETRPERVAARMDDDGFFELTERVPFFDNKISCFNPELLRNLGTEKLEMIYFISRNEGFYPCIEVLRQLYFPANVPVLVSKPHIPQLVCEIPVLPGDTVVISDYQANGWCIGENITRKQHGLFPARCVDPRNNTQFVLLDICDNHFIQHDRSIVVWIANVYPNHLKYYKLFNVPSDADLEKILADLKAGSRQCLVSGNASFLSEISHKFNRHPNHLRSAVQWLEVAPADFEVIGDRNYQ